MGDKKAAHALFMPRAMKAGAVHPLVATNELLVATNEQLRKDLYEALNQRDVWMTKAVDAQKQKTVLNDALILKAHTLEMQRDEARDVIVKFAAASLNKDSVL